MLDLRYVAVTAKDAVVIVGPGQVDGLVYLLTYIEDGEETVERIRALLDAEVPWETLKAALDEIDFEDQ